MRWDPCSMYETTCRHCDNRLGNRVYACYNTFIWYILMARVLGSNESHAVLHYELTWLNNRSTIISTGAGFQTISARQPVATAAATRQARWLFDNLLSLSNDARMLDAWMPRRVDFRRIRLVRLATQKPDRLLARPRASASSWQERNRTRSPITMKGNTRRGKSLYDRDSSEGCLCTLCT